MYKSAEQNEDDNQVSGSYRSRFEGEGFVPFQQDRNPIVVASATEPVRVRIEMRPYAMVRVRVEQGPMLPSVRRPCASSAIRRPSDAGRSRDNVTS